MIKSGRIGDTGFYMESDAFLRRRKHFRRPILNSIFAITLLSAFWSAAWAVDSQTETAAPAIAQPSPVADTGQAFNAGDIAATAFAGSKLIVDSIPPGIDPVSKTFIDPDGIVLRVFSVPNRGDPKTQRMLNPPAIYQAQARDVGHLFGLAFDNLAANGPATPGLYAAATSSFGLQIVGPDRDGDGKPDRLTKGAAGAMFMPGQFGSLPGAGPGTIYKIDKATGNIGVFANVATNGIANSGPGIGGLVFDPVSRAIFASDLDTGLIHAFGSDGSDISQFDHGVSGRPLNKQDAVADDGKRMEITSDTFDPAKPATWGFTQTARRIDALAVHDGRLYYAVAEGPQIWSVGIDSSGKFGSDPRFEVAIVAERSFPITGIVFDADGRMTLTQRGTVENPADYSHFTEQGPAETLRFTTENPDDPNTPDRWKRDAEEYAVGNSKGNRASSGGLALQYTYKDDGSIDFGSCGGTIVVSADALGAKADGHGLQLNAIGLVRPANVPPTQSTFINLTSGENDPETRGYAGGVAALQDCGGSGAPPVAGGSAPVAGGAPSSGLPPVVGGGGTAFPPVEGDELGGGGATTAEGTEGGGGTITNGQLDLAKVPGSTTCSENQSCAFKITVKNGSNKPADKVVISDNPSIGGVPFTKFKLGDVAAPWVCTASAAPGMECTHPPLQPGESADLTLGFTPDPGSLGAATEFNNCASFAGGNAPAANNPPQQAALPPPPAPTSSNNGGLKVETLGTASTCSPATGNCEFEIKITNNTGQPITDQPLKISNTLTVGTQTQAKNNATSMQLPAGLQCQPTGREFNCSQDKLTLAPNQSVSLKVAFSVDTTEGGQANFVQNKTNVTLGPLAGEATGAIGIVDDKKLPEPDANGQQAGGGAGGQPATQACASIPITPPGPIVVNKKGPTKCAPKRTCAFSIDVTNNSAAPVQPPIAIEDTIDLPGTTIAGAVAEPFACDPGGPPFKCRLTVALQPKETKTLSLNLKFDAPADVKSVKNCAIPTQPQAAPGGAGPGQGQAPDQGQQQKQFVPAKKSEFFPFVRNSLRRFASFRPQSFAPAAQLFHFAGGAGGNIGGVGPNNCLKWGMDKGGFRVVQSNGPTVGFGDIKVDANGNATGTASFIADDGPVSGKVEGTIKGSHVDLTVTWNRGVRTGHYVGDIARDGSFTGTNAASNGVRATFKSDRAWFQCALDDLCKKYADDAMAAETEFASLHCGAVGSGRWSDKIQDHITFCMGQPRDGNSLVSSETEARTKELDSCLAFDARCTKAGLAMAAANDEMKALKCPDAIASLQPDKAKAACKTAAIKFSPESLAQSVQQKLAACKATLAANGGPAGGAPGAGGAGGPGAGGAGGPGAGGAADGQGGGGQVQPPANQCVTVELDPNAPEGGDKQQPGGGGEVKPGAVAQNLKITKSAQPCVLNAAKGRFECNFAITVANTGPAQFKGPITIEDTMPGVDGLTIGVTTVPPWSCPSQGDPADGVRACNNRDATIEPGASIALPLTVTVPSADTTLCQIDNSASITEPAGGGPLNADKADDVAVKVSAAIPGATPDPAKPGRCLITKNNNVDQPGGGGVVVGASKAGPLALRKKHAAGSCKGNRTCDFTIEVTNTGAQPVDGPVEFKDDLTGDGALLASAAITAPQPWSCPKQGPGAFACTASLKLGSNESKIFTFTADLGAGIGAVKEMKNCGTLKDAPTPSCATAPLQAPQVPPNNLIIANTASSTKCSDAGGGCAFMVTITNPGADFAGPVVLTDAVTAGDGAKFAGMTAEATGPVIAVGGPPAAMGCPQTGERFDCTSQPTRIAPGQTVQIPMAFKPGANSGAKEIKSCVRLQGGTGEPKCATIPLFDGALLRASKSVLNNEGTCVPNCKFKISLTNTGNAEAPGPFVIKDDYKPFNSDVKIEANEGDFACNISGQSVQCTSTNKGTNVLKPGETTSGQITVSAQILHEKYTNCIDYDPAANAKPSPFEKNVAAQCATIEETAHKVADLQAEMSAPNAGPDFVGICGLNDPSCTFKLKISNTGPISYKGAPFFDAQVRDGTIANMVAFTPKDNPSGWKCGPLGGNKQIQRCFAPANGGEATITQGLFEIAVIPGASWKKNDTLTLCADLTPVPADTNPNNNKGCASVKLDPFNVAISKTGDQSCAPGGDCHFTLNLFNPGPIDHNAPVTISDHLKGLSSAQILSIKPPLPCASQPTQIPFACTSPNNVCLDLNGKPGEKCGPQTFDMVVRLPNDASAQQFSNCASVTKGEKKRSDEESCHAVSLKPVAAQTSPPATEPTRTTPPAAPGDNCTRGMLLIDGGCRCPPGTDFNGRRCWPDNGSGHAYPVQPGTEVPPPPSGCLGGTIFIGGACRCPPGTRFNGRRCFSPIGDGHAYPAQPNPEVPNTTPTTQLPPTTQRPPPVQTSPPQCPEHSTFRRNRCVCLPGYQPIGRRCERVQQPDGGTRETQPGKDRCEPGQNRDPRTGVCFSCSHNDHFENGRCVPNARPVVCRRDTHLENGICVPNQRPQTRDCPAGYKVLDRPNKYGAYCEPPAPTAKCPPSAPEGTPPNCHCPAGTVSREGFCRPANCPPGWIGLPPHCRQPKPTPSPTPTGPTPKPVPQKPECSGDKVLSSSGQCVCPNGTTDVGHNRCADRVK